MIQILCGDSGHLDRCKALAAATPGASVCDASGPALDKKVMRIHTLVWWGHGDLGHFGGLTSADLIGRAKEWVKWNPTIKTMAIITCNSRHGTISSAKRDDGSIETCWVKSYTDQVKPKIKQLGLTLKALPMGMGSIGAHR